MIMEMILTGVYIYIHWVCNIGTAPNANWQHEFEVSNSPLSWTQAKPWMCIDCKAMVLDYHHFQIGMPKLICNVGTHPKADWPN